jgi:Tfp pilus assembly protein PilE
MPRERPRDQAGFTFVEALTVGVIAAILAAVAIPIYTGFIQNQRRSVVKSLATTGAVAGSIYYRRHNAVPTPAQLNLYLADPARYSVQISASGTHVIVRDDLGGGDVVSDSAAFR